MPTPVFPIITANRVLGWRGITWGLTKKIVTGTEVRPSYTGRDAARQRWTRPKYEITLKWSLLKNQRSVAANVMPTPDAAGAPREEFKRLSGFFTARHGRFEPFFLSFTTDGDFFTSAETIHPTTPAVAADPSNPDSRNYQVVRTFGGHVAPVGGVDAVTSAPVFTDDGTPIAGVLYNTPRDGWVRLPAAPATGSVLAWTGHYYYRVAFKRDEAEFEAFADDFWRAKQLVLETRWW